MTGDVRDRWERADDRFHVLLGGTQRALIAAVAIVLVLLSCLALWETGTGVWQQLQAHNVGQALAVGVDTVFVTIILLELLHTVVGRESLAQQVQDFIIIGITSVIRYGLSLVATAQPGGHQSTVIGLAINSVSVLLLVVALWVVRSIHHSLGSAHEP